MDKLSKILNGQPPYRLKQIHKAWFDLNINNYDQITTLPKDLREKIKNISWLSVKEKIILKSKLDNTHKAILKLSDGHTIETVLMGREDKKVSSTKNERYTICVSTQVGCPMGCVFCATGSMGFKRNLTTQEIIDQYRFWQRYFNNNTLPINPLDVRCKKNTTPTPNSLPFIPHSSFLIPQISNIVLMGQGEPLLNYDNVKEAINIILNNTDIGPSKITLSTVGIMNAMDKILTDKDFPPIRFALSLHSAREEIRQQIIPSHQIGFLDWLITWTKKYHQTHPSRSHFIGLEYTLLKNMNDSEEDLKALKKLASKLGHIRINLIPYNTSPNQTLNPSQQSVPEKWRDELMKSGFTVTIRHSHGQDINAACGQLQNKVNK